jgi:predicted phosphodiesterase
VAASEWLNVFVLHQNRVAHTQSAKNLVKESHLARWLDLVVWGHEHECVPDAQVRGPAAAAGACNGHVTSLCKSLQAIARKEASTCCNALPTLHCVVAESATNMQVCN